MSSIPRFTLAAFFTAPKPCEDALADLGIAYNRLADQWEAMHEALEQIARLTPFQPPTEPGGIGNASRIAREALDGL